MIVGNNLFKSAKGCRAHLTNYVSARWKTRAGKPFWLGIAKSKLFVLPEKKVVPPEQEAELRRLHEIYGRQMRALQNFMTANVDNQLDEGKDIAVSHYKKQAKLLHYNWNAESARLREARLKKEEEEATETILNKVMQKEIMLKELKTKVEKIVEKEIEISQTYITQENLDKAIDECFASVSDYNYALDLSGNVYKGESMIPTGKVKTTADGSSQIEEMVLENNSSKENETTEVL